VSGLGPIQGFVGGEESSSVINTENYGLVVTIGAERVDLWVQPWLDPLAAADLLITVASNLRTHGNAARRGVAPPGSESTDGTER
jgi:hypothetical protein